MILMSAHSRAAVINLRPPVHAAAVCLIAAFATVQTAPALDPEKAFHQYRLDVWQPEDGLPQSTAITW